MSLRAAKAQRAVHRRSADWSQVRPEWGLSGNAAFIIGRRALTRGIDLEGRVFLHSYDYREDPDGRLLEVVMTGPQIVGQWINMEHYFSAVDPEGYGSGSKIYHNVVGRFGVMSGPQSDLRTGLSWQTVMNGPRPYHEAMRLLTVIEAPREKYRQGYAEPAPCKASLRQPMVVSDRNRAGRWDSLPLRVKTRVAAC